MIVSFVEIDEVRQNEVSLICNHALNARHLGHFLVPGNGAVSVKDRLPFHGAQVIGEAALGVSEYGVDLERKSSLRLRFSAIG